MPLDTMLEYAETDVVSCREIYQAQQQDLEKPSNVGLRPVFDLMNEMLEFLVEIESNGIRIDLDALAEVEEEFVREKAEIESRLERIIIEVMGDRPINLNSGADMSMVVYSRKVKDKDHWKQVFNIGTTPSGKPLPPPRMSASAFGTEVRKQTEVVKRQIAHQCGECEGRGKIRKLKKDGTPYKRETKCPQCTGSGAVYEDTGKVAGLKLVPKSPMYCSIHGFKTDKVTIKKLIAQATAAEFLKGISRLNAINTYLSSFVHGIQMWTRPDGFLHANFNQTTTRTGRLSSSNPNFQNQPKGGKFPVRRAVVSRFDGGKILEADFSGLEFRVAGELSRDGQIIADILDGKDVHRQTASIIQQKPISDISKDERQAAKAYCVPMDSEILTKTGWKSYGEVSVGETVLTYNQTTGMCEWQPMLDKVFFNDCEVWEFGHSHWKVRATPNHRWYGFRRYEGAEGFRGRKHCVFTTEEITSEHSITTAAYCPDEGDLNMSLEEVCILTWIATDGSYTHSPLTGKTSQGSDGRRRGCTACIIQKKPDQCVSIEHFLRGINATKTVDANGTSRWHLPAEYFRNLWAKSGLSQENPDWVSFVTRMSPEQRRVFIDTFYKAEGTPRNHGERRFSQNSGSLSDALRIALHMDGRDTRITRKRSYTGKVNEVVTERKKAHVTAQRFEEHNRTIEDVWCPRTANQTWVMRQGDVITVLGNTFAPLYGGMGANEPPHVQRYFQEYFGIYEGLAKWHRKLMDGVLEHGIVRIPSGREFAFPNAQRLRSGRITNATNVVNYPVQSFATADIVPLACIRALRRWGDLRSRLILTVHDSIVVDVHPDELDQVKSVLKDAMLGVKDDLVKRFDYEPVLPLDIEIEAGPDWMSMEEIPID
jgi:DNA polymerase I-like protein with 3'-5' exonuclease and polymerase domains